MGGNHPNLVNISSGDAAGGIRITKSAHVGKRQQLQSQGNGGLSAAKRRFKEKIEADEFAIPSDRQVYDY